MSRWKMNFWLDDKNERDLAVGYTIVGLKAERKFASTVRDGIRLITDLRAGRFDVLFELFPTLQTQLQPPGFPPNPPSDQFNAMLTEAAKEGARLALAEAPVHPAPPALSAGLQPIGGIQPLANAKAVDFPTFDDDDGDTILINVRRDPKAGGVIMNNFMDSIGALQEPKASTPILKSRGRE